MENLSNINIDILDRVLAVRLKHDTAKQLLSILANKYFNEEPDGREGLLLFAKDYKDMNELINAILQYTNVVNDELNDLYCITEKRVEEGK